ncbi:MAG: 1-deoxy-D-xylulose-5-phosphate reductoisomerase [Oscillospiraceae bacterium]|jgi:1-deoxy-D-xylulose-5-phosphate reductoisomerase|nr:1-deoxy-D-xylulose-5-phosphate reductoisomerase [Oscillospiraceae bacterium]
MIDGARQVAVLGSTGSVGKQALEVCRSQGIRVAALSARFNIALLEKQARAFLPDMVAVEDSARASALKTALADTSVRVAGGPGAVIEAATMRRADTVVCAIVGIAGLAPALAAAREGKTLALANKESLVAGGKLLTETARANGATILPIDSEHSAIFQCMRAGRREDVTGVLLTASGGPFFGMSAEELKYITPARAVKHPNWEMGAKISVDSATLMNKGLELIEAMWLFGLSADQVEIVVHRQSVVHSGVYYRDASLICQLGVPDMRSVIQYALTYPERLPVEGVGRLSLTAMGSLTFEKPDRDVFTCLSACEQAAARGGLYLAAASAAGEAAVALFLEGKIGFLHIGDIVMDAVNRLSLPNESGLESVMQADALARGYVRGQAERYAPQL